MKTRIAVFAAMALAAIALLAAACGGGDGEEAGIRTRQGLAVAAAVAAAERSGGDNGEASDTAAPEPAAGTTGFAPSDRGVASPDFFPFPYPTLQESLSGITVQGFGSASVDGDGAILELYFGGKVTGAEPVPSRDQTEPDSGAGVAPSAPQTQQEQLAQPITEADLQPVVDAIVAQGVPRDDIEVTVYPSYGDPYYGGSATIRVTVRDINAVDGVVNAATEAAAGLANIALQSTNVAYTVSDCAALEQAAMEAAVADARERSQGFATVLGVGLGPVAGASNYVSFPYGGSPCETGFGGPYPLGGVTYAEGQPAQVEVYATVAITFAIQ